MLEKMKEQGGDGGGMEERPSCLILKHFKCMPFKNEPSGVTKEKFRDTAWPPWAHTLSSGKMLLRASEASLLRVQIPLWA